MPSAQEQTPQNLPTQGALFCQVLLTTAGYPFLIIPSLRADIRGGAPPRTSSSLRSRKLYHSYLLLPDAQKKPVLSPLFAGPLRGCKVCRGPLGGASALSPAALQTPGFFSSQRTCDPDRGFSFLKGILGLPSGFSLKTRSLGPKRFSPAPRRLNFLAMLQDYPPPEELLGMIEN